MMQAIVHCAATDVPSPITTLKENALIACERKGLRELLEILLPNL